MTVPSRHRWLKRVAWGSAVLAVIVVAVWQVPLIRHHPICMGRPEDGQPVSPGVFPSLRYGDAFVVEGRLADHYVDVFTSGFERDGIVYVRFGGVVLFRFWDWFTDPGGWISNADRKTVDYLATYAGGRSVWESMPADLLRRFSEMRRFDLTVPHCEFTRALVLRNGGRD